MNVRIAWRSGQRLPQQALGILQVPALQRVQGGLHVVHNPVPAAPVIIRFNLQENMRRTLRVINGTGGEG
jgi:hypothetical protein